MIKVFNMMAGFCLACLCMFTLAMEGMYVLMLHYMSCEYGCELCELVGDLTYGLNGNVKIIMYIMLALGAIVAIRFLLKGIEIFFNGNFL